MAFIYNIFHKNSKMTVEFGIVFITYFDRKVKHDIVNDIIRGVE